MPDDCTKLKEASREIREWISDQPSVKEESITDWLLRDISKRVKNVYYTSFSRMTEARTTGADWEWWFLFDCGSYRMRIQAKKLAPYGTAHSGTASRYSEQSMRLVQRELQKSRHCEHVEKCFLFTHYQSLTKDFRNAWIDLTGADSNLF